MGGHLENNSCQIPASRSLGTDDWAKIMQMLMAFCEDHMSTKAVLWGGGVVPPVLYPPNQKNTWTLKLPIKIGYHPITLGVKPIFKGIVRVQVGPGGMPTSPKPPGTLQNPP